MKFKPTFLMIKQHSVTGKLYFCKTIRNPEKYMGSGSHWLRHIKKHGKEHVVNLWYCLFTDKNDCMNFALSFSKMENIILSDQWLNLMYEDGIGSGCGAIQSEETKKKRAESIRKYYDDHIEAKEHQSIVMKQVHRENPELRKRTARIGEANGMFGCVRPDNWREEHSKFMTGENNPMYGKCGELSPNYGKEPYNKNKKLEELHSKEEARRIRKEASTSAKNREKITCPYCSKTGDISNMKRWHFEKCKVKND